MAEYLDKAAVMAILDEYDRVVDENQNPTDGIFEKTLTKFSHDLSDLMRRALNTVPAADVAPVVHAHWEKHIERSHPIEGWVVADTIFYRCSNCGTNEDGPTPYCRLCGAKMDGRQSDG